MSYFFIVFKFKFSVLQLVVAIYSEATSSKREDFSIYELSRSATAARLGIDNSPTPSVKKNLEKLINEVLDPLREAWGAPIIVTSGYRSPKLNKVVGGSKTSQHVYGQAADLKTVGDKPENNLKLFELAKKLIEQKKITVGQLIDEYNGDWIHISTPGGHKNQILHIR